MRRWRIFVVVAFVVVSPPVIAFEKDGITCTTLESCAQFRGCRLDAKNTANDLRGVLRFYKDPGGSGDALWSFQHLLLTWLNKSAGYAAAEIEGQFAKANLECADTFLGPLVTPNAPALWGVPPIWEYIKDVHTGAVANCTGKSGKNYPSQVVGMRFVINNNTSVDKVFILDKPLEIDIGGGWLTYGPQAPCKAVQVEVHSIRGSVGASKQPNVVFKAAPNFPSDQCGVVVRNQSWGSPATTIVQDLRIEGFPVGLCFEGGGAIVLTGLQLANNKVGIRLAKSDRDSLVMNNEINAGESGILLQAGAKAVVLRNRIHGTKYGVLEQGNGTDGTEAMWAAVAANTIYDVVKDAIGGDPWPTNKVASPKDLNVVPFEDSFVVKGKVNPWPGLAWKWYAPKPGAAKEYSLLVYRDQPKAKETFVRAYTIPIQQEFDINKEQYADESFAVVVEGASAGLKVGEKIRVNVLPGDWTFLNAGSGAEEAKGVNTVFVHRPPPSSLYSDAMPLYAAVDQDADYLVADCEKQLGTLDTKKDTDGDGLTDPQEDANYNCKTDSGETNPTLSDTDGDKVSDYCELFIPNKTNPVKADSDGDGLSDYQELVGSAPGVMVTKADGCAALFAKAAAKSDPNKADTDGDGVVDKDDPLPTIAGAAPVAGADKVPEDVPGGAKPGGGEQPGAEVVPEVVSEVVPKPPVPAGPCPSGIWVNEQCQGNAVAAAEPAPAEQPPAQTSSLPAEPGAAPAPLAPPAPAAPATPQESSGCALLKSENP